MTFCYTCRQEGSITVPLEAQPSSLTQDRALRNLVEELRAQKGIGFPEKDDR